MKRFSSISKVAAAAVLGSVLFTGCEFFNDNDAVVVTPPAAATSVNAADGYVVDLNGTAATAFCSDTNMSYSSALTVGTNGKLTFDGVALTENCTISVGANAFIDINNNGTFDANDTQIGFELKAPGDAEYVSQLTTLVVAMTEEAATLTGTAKTDMLAEAATLKTAVKTFNPVTAATSVATSTGASQVAVQKLMMLGEVLKTAMKSATKTQLSKINTATFTDTTTTLDDVNVTSAITSAGMDASVVDAVTTKAAAIKSVVKILDKIDSAVIDIDALVTNMSDGGKSLTAALTISAQAGKTVNTNDASSFVKAGTTVSEINTAVISIDTEVATAATAVASTPPKLSLGTSLTIGSEVVALNSGTFTHTIDTNASTTVADFYNIALSSATSSKDINGTETVSLTVTIKDSDTSDQIILTLGTVNLTSTTTGDLNVTIPSGSDISIAPTGLASLGNASATTTSALTTTDLSVNVSSILNNLSTTSVADEITALNTYLATANVYDVNLTIGDLNTSVLSTDYTTITGTITVK